MMGCKGFGKEECRKVASSLRGGVCITRPAVSQTAGDMVFEDELRESGREGGRVG